MSGKRGPDKVPRKRRKNTDQEKLDRRRQKAQKKHGSVATYFRGNHETNDLNESVDDEPETIDPLQLEDTAINIDDGITTFSEEVDAGCSDDDQVIVANLHIDEDASDELDDGIEAEPDNFPPTKVKSGVQSDYMRCIQDRLKKEVANKTKGLETKWLLDLLKQSDGWIRKEQAQSIIQMLASPSKSPSTYQDVRVKWKRHNKQYYRDVKIWLPDLLLLGGCTPFCPTCKSDSNVSRHGFNSNHIGRMIVGLKENYYVMSCRYKCTACEQKKRELVQAAVATESTTPVKWKYTFMGWDPDSLPLTALGAGDEFPAFLTWRAGLDKSLVDMMRALFDKGIRPESFSDMVLELHSKNYTKSWLKYEREFAMERSKATFGVINDWPEFSTYNDPEKWNDHVPTGSYFSKAYKLHHRTLRSHYDKQVKMRGAVTLSIDASFKEAGNLCQWRGRKIFNALETGLNEFGEVRIQHHLFSDGKDQKKTPLEAFKDTTQQYGLPSPKLVFTDNPAGDYNFYVSMFESLQQQREIFNSHLPDSVATSSSDYPYDPSTPHLKIVSTKEDINLAVAAMVQVMNTEKGFALDSEHKVVFHGRGMGKEESPIGLIQIAFFNRVENDRIQYLFIRTHKLKKLPGQLVTLLSGSVPVVGVNVGGDLARIAKDFGLGNAIGNRPKKTIINLGSFARKRDVVQNGSIGMKPLVKTVLGLTIDKNREDTFSDWNAKELSPSQIKYATIDVDAPLKVYEELSKRPDLTQRLTSDEAVIGKKVDVVPRYGSVACMATRAASGTIVHVDFCSSPDGIVQSKVRAGKGMAAVQIDTVYSPSMQVPYYRKTGSSEKPTLADFGSGLLVLPVQMLKDHIASESIRSYIEDSSNSATSTGLTVPAPSTTPVSETPPSTNAASSEIRNTVAEDEEYTNEYLTEGSLEDTDLDLTSSDIEMLRAAVVEGESVNAGRAPLRCEWLSEAPKPSEIQDKFSPQLGDVFHAMNRPYVPIKHEAKKGYFVALQNAFYVYKEDQMEQLINKLEDEGMTSDDIEKMKYYNSRVFIGCVEREVPPPSILYWRVRAVFALYGGMVDSKTGKPLFNAQAWTKAKGILHEILLGYYSDPPGVCMYNKKMNKNGSVFKNKYGLEVIECNRGTNRTEAYHKNLIIAFRNWHTGIEMSDCLLAERRHRHNHICSERRRFRFPILGHCDTWLVDALQLLILENRGRVLYPNWSNASEYKDTNESFDTVAIHSLELDTALKNEWENRIDRSAVKLTSDQKYMCDRMNIPLPFLPFSTKEENELFANLALTNDFPINDANAAAIIWCKHVNGVDIFPKLPVHIRVHKESFERNQRVRNCVDKAKSGQERLDELNRAVKPNEPSNKEPVPFPESMPEIQAEARHNLPFVTTGGTAIGALPIPCQNTTKRVRGHDRKPRAGRRCGRCILNNGEYAATCNGRGGSGGSNNCEYFDEQGNRKAV